jgi:hypothetical protein
MHRVTLIGLFAIAFVSLPACGPDGIDTNVERFLTIHQGIYGQTLVRNDAGDTSLSYATGRAVASYATAAATAPEALTTSKEHGFYELALAVGPHHICVGALLEDGSFQPWDSSIDVVVAEDEVSRHDHENGPGRFWF